MQSRTIREGSVGLFALLGLVIFAGVTIWLRGGGWREKSYKIMVEFSDVSGLQLGAPVRYRGVQVGKLIGLQPQAENVLAVLEISSSEIRIPRKDIKIQTNRYGLIGEASIDITPSIALSAEAESINPLNEKKCNPDDPEALILCNNAHLIGDAGAQLVSSLTKLAEVYGDPELLNNFARTITTEAKLDQLSRDLSTLSKRTEKEITSISRDFSRTSAALNRTASEASLLVGNINDVILQNRQNINTTFEQATELISTTNQLVTENREKIQETIVLVNNLTGQLTALATNLNETAVRINTTLEVADTEKIMQDIQILTANATEISKNLKEVSETLKDPATLLTLQQTLDSARSTFENAEKITSDIDELIGDPEFREKLRRLVEGLSNLVSSTEQLDWQIQKAQQLKKDNQVLTQQLESHPQLKPNNTTSIPPQLSLMPQESNQPPLNEEK
jgi:phospholipid/cholesterol/gamma-HCH transport system substrate-binding protein